VQRYGDDAQKIYPDAKIVRDLDELLAMKSISLIAICDAKRNTFFRLLKSVWTWDGHIVVDKPFTTTLAEARALVEIARRNDRVLTVYQERRCDGDFRTIQELLANGTLGKIVRFRISV